MRLNVQITMDNAAFGETDHERCEEAARILAQAARKIRELGVTKNQVSLKDINGNTVGEFHYAAINAKRPQ